MKLSSGTLVLGVFAALFGLVGAYAAKQHLAEKPEVEVPATPAAQVEIITVPMAAVALPAGRTITNADMVVRKLTWEQIRAQGLPTEFMSAAGQLIGRTLRVELAKGSPFTPADLYPEGTGPNVAERLKPGYRAVSVPLGNPQPEIALLSPGAVVDVMFRTFPKGNLPETTVTLLEKIEILAINEQSFPGGRVNGANGNGGGRQSATVTLACTPEQVSALKVVEGRGTLSLVLRSSDDLLAGVSPVPQTLESLLDLPEPKPPVMTQVYRRGQLTTAVFEDGRQVAVSEGFSGLPVPAETADARPSVTTTSYARPAVERAAGAPASGGKTEEPCSGCGHK
ncbi:MAG: Flp pilus assembly protein CpaB [Thermoguttaceae bacterium]|jgi:pilus assembly protein CpaB|nr:Flp pilus assembly protein CpaB [Thermoguttaceae bacterium]